jgi:hypothetical protein
MKARRLLPVAILLLIPEVALSQEDFDYLPLEVGNWWRYELTYTGPGEPLPGFVSEVNLSIDGVVRLDTSAISVPGEVTEVPVSDNAAIHYLASGSLLRFVADLYARWTTGLQNSPPPRTEEVLLRWRSHDDLGPWSKDFAGDVVLLGGLRQGQDWYVYRTPQMFWVPAEARRTLHEFRLPRYRYSSELFPVSGHINAPAGRFYYPSFQVFQSGFAVATSMYFSRGVGIVSVVVRAAEVMSYDLVEAKGRIYVLRPSRNGNTQQGLG